MYPGDCPSFLAQQELFLNLILLINFCPGNDVCSLCLHIFKCTSDDMYFLSWKQTLWTLIRLLLREQSDLGPYCLQKEASRVLAQISDQRTIIIEVNGRKKLTLV